ncbi:unnamed protein product [Meloidogyne enterolobii]|uniref:Uncharacterized protein n=1 Tax=Meloidogyne enterolobii TaxID=390850 RepID=A0ACB0ZBP9_MELEN
MIFEIFNCSPLCCSNKTFFKKDKKLKKSTRLNDYLQRSSNLNKKYLNYERNDWKKYCGIKLHVLEATKIISIFGCLFAFFPLFLFKFSLFDINYFNLVINCLTVFLANGSLFLAIKQRKAILCLPFLLINMLSISLIFNYIFIILQMFSPWPVLDTILGIGYVSDQLEEEDRELASASIRLLLLWLFLFIFIACLLLWIELIVIQTFKYLTKISVQIADIEVYRSVYFIDNNSESKNSKKKNSDWSSLWL